MRVELIYDKRNVAGLTNANEMIKAELTKRVHQVFPGAEVKVKPMQANGINTDATKQEKSVLNRLVEEMFEQADESLVHEF
ncbi:TPA: DinI family protein [Yersinia enterocolitica]|nr:DinI family protein [Yersinia enterocolitica]